MKSIRTRLLLAAMAVLIGTAIMHAQTTESVSAPPPTHGRGFGVEDHIGFLAKQLNLTDDQQAQMKTIMQREHPAMKPLMEQQHQIDQQLRQYVEGAFDQAKVQALANQKAKIQAQMTVQETRIHNEMYQLLTADQQTQLKQLEAQREQRMQQHMKQAPDAAPAQE